MARTWYSVTVELLGGRGGDLWPWPGRIFAVGPSHTFMDLANAVNDAFARWDRSHLSVFTLSDGRIVTDEESGTEMASSPGGPLASPLDIEAAKVTRTVSLGEEFQYTFDLGDDWVHRCVVDQGKIDPVEELGIRPDKPLPYWGWGAMPDQYGRRWSDDDGVGRVPPRPATRHPMVTRDWPASERVPALDATRLRQAAAARDADAVLEVVRGRDIDDVLQQVGLALAPVLERGREDDAPTVLSVINRLTWRAGPGDRELAEDLLARLRDEPLPGRVVPVDLDMLATVMEADPELLTGGVVDLHAGEVLFDEMMDEAVVGEDAVPDLDADPDRWLPVDLAGSRQGWQDMADFAARQHDVALRDRLERAIEGRGAFRRFRDEIHDEGLAEQWELFSTDRGWGRARELLADAGIRVGIASAQTELS